LVLPQTKVNDALLSPNGRFVITLSGDSGIFVPTVYRTDSGARLAVLKIKTDHTLLATAWSPDSRHILTVQEGDGNTVLWDESGTPVRAFATSRIFGDAFVSWSPTGDRFLLVSDGASARLWRADGAPVSAVSVDESSRVSWSADGRLFAAMEPGGRDATVWDADGRRQWSVEPQDNGDGPGNGIRVVRFNATSDRLLGVQERGPVLIWSASGQPLGSVGNANSFFNNAYWSPTGDDILVIEGDRGTLRGLDGTERARFDGLGPSRLFHWAGTGRYVVSGCHGDTVVCAWEPNGRQVAIIDAGPFISLNFCGTTDGKEVLIVNPEERSASMWTIDSATTAEFEGDSSVQAGDWRADGSRLVTASGDGVATIWDRHGHLLGRTSRQDAALMRVAWTSDGHIVTTSSEGVTTIWNGNALPVLKANVVGKAASSQSGDLLVATAQGRALALKDSQGRDRGTLGIAAADVKALAWSPDNMTIATAPTSGPVVLWTIGGGHDVVAKPLGAKSAGAEEVLWSPDGKKVLAIHDSSTGTIWDRAGLQLGELAGEANAISEAAWSPRGEHVATRSGLRPDLSAIWTSAGVRITQIPGAPTLMTWRPDGQALVTFGHISGEMWNVKGEKVASLDTGMSRIASASWSPDGKLLAVSAYNGDIRLYDVAGHLTAIHSIAKPNVIAWHVDWSPDGRFLLGCYSDGRSRIWPAEAIVKFASAYVTRELTTMERERYVTLKD
jgi:WD40 repeat protein